MTLARLAIAWLCGIALAARFEPPVAPVLMGLAPLGAGLVLWRDDRRARLALGLGLCLLLGAARQLGATPAPGPDHVAALNGGPEATLRGRIAAEPDRRDRRTDYRVAAEAVREGDGWRPAHGLVLVQAARYPRHAYGETVLVTGALEEPPVLDDFDYRAWLARKGILSLVRRPRIETVASGGGHPLRRALLAVKDRARRALAAALPEPEAALATGILLGDARGIPAHVDEAFRITNTSHVIAISGSNISLLVVVLMMTCGRLLGRRRAVPVVLVVLVSYTALVGADAAVVRAAIMGGLLVVGGLVGRPSHAATALLASAWAMTAYRPGYLWDLGFQLSFAATLGLVVFTARFGRGLTDLLAVGLDADRARAVARLLHEAVVVTGAAQLTTWPLLAWQVGQVSLAGLAANLLILPAQPAVMGLGALTAVGGSAWLPAGRLLGAAAWLPLAYTVRVVEIVARMPYAAVAWSMPGWLMVAYYVVLALAVSPGVRAALSGALPAAAGRLADLRSWRGRPGGIAAATSPSEPAEDGETGRLAGPWPPAARIAPAIGRWTLVALGALCPLVWAGALARPDGLLHVHMLDVGQGDAILVVTPSGRRMLVDGGPSPSAVLDGLGRVMAPWDRRLDIVVLTHPDADHVGGLPAVLERYDVGLLVESGYEAQTPDAAAWADAAAREGAPRLRATAGGRIVLDDAAGVSAEILWPPHAPPSGTEADANNSSVVLRLQYGAVTVLLTGDAEEPVERALLASGVPLAARVLKVAHHGSAGSSGEAFVRAVAPAAALIGVGADNSFGHPAPATLARLAPAAVWRTDRDGTIELLIDGRDAWVRARPAIR